MCTAAAWSMRAISLGVAVLCSGAAIETPAVGALGGQAPASVESAGQWEGRRLDWEPGTGVEAQAGDEVDTFSTGRNIVWPSEEPVWHLAPPGAFRCDYGWSATESECEAAVAQLAAAAGQTPGRGIVMDDWQNQACGEGGWGSVPLRCSAQSGGDWSAHYKRYGTYCGSAGYQLVCKELRENLVVENAPDAGGWGGWCTCPDGQVYGAGDSMNDCGSLACIGGTPGECFKEFREWENQIVICARTAAPTPAPSAPTLAPTGTPTLAPTTPTLAPTRARLAPTLATLAPTTPTPTHAPSMPSAASTGDSARCTTRSLPAQVADSCSTLNVRSECATAAKLAGGTCAEGCAAQGASVPSAQSAAAKGFCLVHMK